MTEYFRLSGPFWAGFRSLSKITIQEKITGGGLFNSLSLGGGILKKLSAVNERREGIDFPFTVDSVNFIIINMFVICCLQSMYVTYASQNSRA